MFIMLEFLIVIPVHFVYRYLIDQLSILIIENMLIATFHKLKVNFL